MNDDKDLNENENAELDSDIVNDESNALDRILEPDEPIEEVDDAQEEAEPWEDEAVAPVSQTDLDVDAALASLANLDDDLTEFTATGEMEHMREDFGAETEEQLEAAETETQHELGVRNFDVPPIYTMTRGQPASVTPALGLMVFGAWLTFSLGSDSPPELWQAVAFGSVIVCLCILAYWLSTGRRAAGAAVTALSITGIIGGAALLASSEDLGAEGWPLLVAILGAAIFVSSVFSRGGSAGRGLLTGIVLMFAGGFGYAISSDALSLDLDRLTDILLPALAVVVVILFIAPVFARGR